MAYAALISLANTTDSILKHSRISTPISEKQQIISLREYVTPSEAFLEKFPDKFKSLERRMREVINEAEYILEHLQYIKLIKSSTGDKSRCDPRELELQLEKVMDEFWLITGEVKVLEKVMEEFPGEVENIEHNSPRRGDSSALSSSSTAPPYVVVGFDDYVKDVKDRLCGETSRLQVIPICGMGGIGKTTLARKVYEDPVIMEKFVIRVWVTISQDFSSHRIVSSLLESLKELKNRTPKNLRSNDKEKLWKILMLRKYLIVIDDIWSIDAWDSLKRMFPDAGNGSRILLTTRLSNVASYPDSSSKICEMQLMDANQSWSLLKKKVFRDGPSPELEDIGKEIAGSCKGLPLALVVISGLLSRVDKNPASWQEIAEKLKSVETTEQEQIEEILSLSYTHLPQYLRPCFLYMGSFPEDQKINVSRLIRLWVAEGFVRCPNKCQTLEEEAETRLEDLVRMNLVLVTEWKSDGRIKSCSLHDLMRDLSIRKAHESKFRLSLMDWNIENEHSLEKVKKVELDCVKSVRLLRVLDAEALDIESLPHELFDIFHLRYLTIRHNYHLPSYFLFLQNLQTLIIHQKSKSEFGARAYDLWLHWCMPQLRHVYFHGTISFDESATSLDNLQTVSYVSHASCTERILKLIPDLKKLKIDCSRGAHHDNTACLNDLVNLNQHYEFGFPMKLKKLCLRDLILSCNDMMIVGSLPDLRVLKMKGCGCIGRTWETTQGQFVQLEFLLVEDLDLESWITESSHFPMLKRLLLHQCRHLKRIPSDNIGTD